ncbi:hypothetical protein L226DRAFT_615071 [Lentinus tigrinus ALCF2SS1-7]|uniref:uncharacterized protein n=1 Tax=Lentinus tigrinus ALCF2SS1-7 TaxID=1328758 RepID=UPI0011663143|nr:hypothetical protein L226DRAFT_615071 [Lentinus tigrinus ALCF2SS1-7]
MALGVNEPSAYARPGPQDHISLHALLSSCAVPTDDVVQTYPVEAGKSDVPDSSCLSDHFISPPAMFLSMLDDQTLHLDRIMVSGKVDGKRCVKLTIKAWTLEALNAFISSSPGVYYGQLYYRLLDHFDPRSEGVILPIELSLHLQHGRSGNVIASLPSHILTSAVH